MKQIQLTEKDKIELDLLTDLARRRLSEGEYTPGQYLNAALSGKKLDRIPYQLYAYAAYLIGETVQNFQLNPVIRFKSTCAQIIRYGGIECDNASRINSYKIGEHLGAELKYLDDGSPSTKKYIVKDKSDIKKLRIPDLETFLAKDLWSMQNLRARLDDMIGPPVSFLYAPFNWVATYAREGSLLFMDLEDDPGFVHQMCRFATDMQIQIAKYLSEKSGGCGFFCPDGFAEMHSPEQYAEFGYPYTAELINAVPECLFYIAPPPTKLDQITDFYKLLENHKNIINMGSSLDPKYPLKNKDDLQKYCDILTDLGRPYNVAINQTLLKIGTPEEVEANVREMIDIGKKGNMILRTDVIDGPAYPPENIQAFINAVEKYGKY
jgi:uroporphyrinogen-III decarboxylase